MASSGLRAVEAEVEEGSSKSAKPSSDGDAISCRLADGATPPPPPCISAISGSDVDEGGGLGGRAFGGPSGRSCGVVGTDDLEAFGRSLGATVVVVTPDKAWTPGSVSTSLSAAEGWEGVVGCGCCCSEGLGVG